MSEKGEEDYEVVHQLLSISSINFKRRSLAGHTELTIRPSSDVVTFISLNCVQCRIYNVMIDEISEVKYTYDDPFQQVCPEKSKRKLDYFLSRYQHTMLKNDYDFNNQGELKIEVPKEMRAKISTKATFKVRVEFAVEDPVCGLHFCDSSPNQGHLYTASFANSARCCFPCIDSSSARCAWQLEFNVLAEHTVVSTGRITEHSLSSDEKHKSYTFTLDIPTAAPGVGFAVGHFDVIGDPSKSNVTYFCPPGLKPLLENTTDFLQRVYPIYESYLNMAVPFGDYKIVFVDELLSDSQNFASLTTASLSLLHSRRMIDQTLVTRRVLGMAVATQYFGVFIVPETSNDSWLVVGIKYILFLLFLKAIQGNNECRFWVYQQMETVYAAESEQLLPPLHLKENSHAYPLTSGVNAQYFHMHPMLSPEPLLHLLGLKSMLLMRMVEHRLSPQLLQQCVKKLLTLAWTNPNAGLDRSNINALLSTQDFLKTVQVVSGKDLTDFMDRYVYQPGFTQLNISFAFNRKRNVTDVIVKQKPLHDCSKFVGPVQIAVQEVDGSFSSMLQVEENDDVQELACHSKSRRNKKKKIPLFTGEEVDIDLSHSDQDSPVMWMRVDSEMVWLRKMNLEMPDYMWQYMIQYERDVVYQHMAAEVLPQYPTPATIQALSTVVLDTKCYYKVRIRALQALAECVSNGGDASYNEDTVISLYKKLFGSVDNEDITMMNDFTDFPHYFLHKAFMSAIGSVKDSLNCTPPSVVSFLYSQLYYNDNQSNKYDDSQLLADIIDGLTLTVPRKAVQGVTSRHVQQILPTVVCLLNIDKKLPSYQQSVSGPCLRFIAALIQRGHIMGDLKDSSIFSAHLRQGQSYHVRCVAIELLVKFIKSEGSECDLNTLLSIVQLDPSARIRVFTVQQLAALPLFARHEECSLNHLALVERLWKLLNEHVDFHLRCHLAQLYYTLYGRTTPSCVPSSHCAVVIDLKGQTARTNVTGINPLPSRYIEEDKKSKFRGEEEYSERKKKKHKYSDKFA